MQAYSRVILDSIERERAGQDYLCTGADKEQLKMLLAEISRLAGRKLQYLAEIDAFIIPGAGKIIAEYIYHFSSESVRGYLLPNLVSDKIADCDIMVLDLYNHFRLSEEYISKPDMPAPAHIYTRYDSAIRKMKPKRLKHELAQLMFCPRDFFYLPQSMKMLASWRVPEIKEKLIQYSSENNVTEGEIGLDLDKVYYPPVSFIKREIRFTAIDCLRYYPCAETESALRKYVTDTDKDMRAAAKKILQYL